MGAVWNLRLKVCSGSVKFQRLPAQCIQRRSSTVYVDAIPGRSSVGLRVVCFRGQGKEGDMPAEQEEKRKKQENAETQEDEDPMEVRRTKVGRFGDGKRQLDRVRCKIELKLNRRQWSSLVSVRDVRIGLQDRFFLPCFFRCLLNRITGLFPFLSSDFIMELSTGTLHVSCFYFLPETVSLSPLAA